MPYFTKRSFFQMWVGFTGLVLFWLTAADAQTVGIHSHNDYAQDVPFWEAYASGAASIEVDVVLTNGRLYVAHEEASVMEGRTLTSTYLSPVRKAFELGVGKNRTFQLLIDIKTDAYRTLDQIVAVLEQYPDILWQEGSEQGVTIVISGNRPLPADYVNYPEYVRFDHQSLEDLERIPLQKVALVSLPFYRFSAWNGKGRMAEEELMKIRDAVKLVHARKKPIRFWGTPDSKPAWKKFCDLGIDLINTDQPFRATDYLSTLGQRVYARPHVTDIYHPEFLIDGQPKPVQNVILLIGDGNGLAQLSAGMYANNNQLTVMALKNIGLLKTQSADDFTTDSAAGASALATGRKTKNRAIGVSPEGTPQENLTEHLQQYGYRTGIVTTDHITGATPAAFYAHQPDREMVHDISRDLSKSKINLFIGAGKNDFLAFGTDEIAQLRSAGFSLLPNLGDLSASTEDRVGYFAARDALPAVTKGRKGFLRKATKLALSYLSRGGNPFFLMVEGAKIDGGGHDNVSGQVVEAVIDFDQAVAEALKFADEHKNTLVLVTADHETGGVAIPGGNMAKGAVELAFSTHDHTGIMVPIFAYGPHSGNFRGVYENTLVFHKIVALIEKYQQ